MNTTGKKPAEETTEMVMGFEWSKAIAAKLRSNDLTMRLLAKLQEDGVAICSKSAYNGADNSTMRLCENEYWTRFENDHNVVLVIEEFKQVYEG